MQTRYFEKSLCIECLLLLQILVAPAMGHADTEWFDDFYRACEQLGCRSIYFPNIRRNLSLGFKYQKKYNLRFEISEEI